MIRSAILAVEFQAASDRPAGVPRSLFTIAGFGGTGAGRRYAVVPDGQRFIATVPVADPVPRPATVILDWQATLAKKR